MLAHLYWNPDNVFFTVPILNIAVTWYGVLFALGFFIALRVFTFLFSRFLCSNPYFRDGDIDWRAFKRVSSSELGMIKAGDVASCNRLVDNVVESKKLTKFLSVKLSKYAERGVKFAHSQYGNQIASRLRVRLCLEEKFPKIFICMKERAKLFADKLLVYMIIATIVGARLSFIIFYQNPVNYLLHPLSVFKTWEGGLSSHGGILAIFLSVYIFHKKYGNIYREFSVLKLLDHVAVSAMFVCFTIRVGNFFNQEILGHVTNVPWGIIFGNPIDDIFAVARHPVQLYEAVTYLLVFVFSFYTLHKNYGKISPGKVSGLIISISFFTRFLLEFLKSNQSIWFDTGNHFLCMGQVLSIPMIAFGAYLIVRKGTRRTGLGKSSH